jgi:hypothetical protein
MLLGLVLKCYYLWKTSALYTTRGFDPLFSTSVGNRGSSKMLLASSKMLLPVEN